VAISNNISDEAAAVRMGIKKKNVKGLRKDHAISSKLKFTYSTDMESTIGASSNPDKLFYGGILKDKSMGHEQQLENEDMISRVSTVAKKYLKTKEYLVFREKFLGEDGEIKANLEVSRNLEIPYSSINDILNRAIRKVRIKIKNGE
jgi:DNA-directed RNA polymerase sigma subunit (sigma70/sigma32)